jgi:predicted HAD superfamily phosphohydrolase YqeG
MTIQAIILDLSDTLLNNSDQVVPGVSDMIARLKNQNIEIMFVLSLEFHQISCFILVTRRMILLKQLIAM